MRRLTSLASLKETCSDFLLDILKNPPGGDSRLDMEDVMKTSSRRHRLTVVQLCYNCNSFVLFNGNLAHKEPNYSQKPVTDHDAFQSIFIANNAGRDNPTIDVIEGKTTVVFDYIICIIVDNY